MRWARLAGRILQALVLGVLLFLAILKLLAIHSNARVFHYQGF